MNQKILATAPLLILTGLAGTGIFLPAQATLVGSPLLKKDVKPFEYSSRSSGHDLAIALFVIGAILAFGATMSAVYKAFNLGKDSSRTADLKHEVKENKPTTSIEIAPAVYVEQAYKFLHQGDVKKAIAEFNHGIRIHSDNAYLYTERANFRRKNLGDNQGALEDYTQAIHLHPDNALLYLWRSQLYYQIGDNLKAMADHNTAMRLAPEDTMYHFFKANANSAKR
ncbi:MAG: tetratricopeptide repeat protein [Cyanomargarita calcarea GSE-NOS-MK-12-04C]|jgi:tetratricopeptide (TPR) repeat protein|uniref:Tetratricopeptide repeat protein n=1 Tax=Cyanomargarita calcarea GSE-NOS-MK-12-04C TaxID=2839659 RepID=A0A951URP0_9CYAN|nr:tetratricopeptide repeat protein [Cyanomargarita calcarea GSE-NOS-MK-12-04C]